jgi:hypothetical protein
MWRYLFIGLTVRAEDLWCTEVRKILATKSTNVNEDFLRGFLVCLSVLGGLNFLIKIFMLRITFFISSFLTLSK